ADTRNPIAQPPACSAGATWSTNCACSGGCSNTASMWFSCHQTGTAPLSNLGLRFERASSQPGSQRSWQVSNDLGWPAQSGVPPVDNYQPTVAYGSNPTQPGPTPTYSGYTDQWYTSGVTQTSKAAPVGPGMWACTKNGILYHSLNGGFGPLQP